jgi:hypothetical protein
MGFCFEVPIIVTTRRGLIALILSPAAFKRRRVGSAAPAELVINPYFTGHQAPPKSKVLGMFRRKESAQAREN